jgi:formylglycine-generating enzyme required for sulfatase activity
MIAAAGLALVALALVSTGCNSTPSSGFDLVEIPGGTFVMGDAEGEADEAPRRVTVEPFRLMRTEVTNRMFKASRIGRRLAQPFWARIIDRRPRGLSGDPGFGP